MTRAVQEALDRHRYPTAYARFLFCMMITGIPTRLFGRLSLFAVRLRPAHDQRVEFDIIVRHEKRQVKKDHIVECYFNGNVSDLVLSRVIVVVTTTAINTLALHPYTSPSGTSGSVTSARLGRRRGVRYTSESSIITR